MRGWRYANCAHPSRHHRFADEYCQITPLPRCNGHTVAMGVTWTVFAESEPEALAELERACQLLGLEPLGRPSQVIGRDRWMARARVPSPQVATGHE